MSTYNSTIDFEICSKRKKEENNIKLNLYIKIKNRLVSPRDKFSFFKMATKHELTQTFFWVLNNIQLQPENIITSTKQDTPDTTSP